MTATVTNLQTTAQTEKMTKAAQHRYAATRSVSRVNPLKRRRKRTLYQCIAPFIIAILIGALALASGVALARRGEIPALPASVSITVRQGDTLWGLAKSFGDYSAPLLDRVDALAAANEMNASNSLYPGQRITIPISDADTFNRLKNSGRLSEVASASTGRGSL
jgi:nucleoid-associated protein YgaU